MRFPIELVVLLQRSEILSVDLIFCGQSWIILDYDLYLSHLVDFAVVEIEFLEKGVDYLLVL